MKSILELNEKKVPAVRVDNSLNTYEKEVLFPKKLAKANAALKNTNLKEVLSKMDKGQCS